MAETDFETVRDALVLFGSEVGDQSLRHEAQAALAAIESRLADPDAEVVRLRQVLSDAVLERIATEEDEGALDRLLTRLQEAEEENGQLRADIRRGLEMRREVGAEVERLRKQNTIEVHRTYQRLREEGDKRFQEGVQRADALWQEEVERLRDALEFYANERHYYFGPAPVGKIVHDRGERARATLHPEEKSGGRDEG